MKAWSLLLVLCEFISNSVSGQFHLDSLPLDEQGKVRYEIVADVPGSREQLFVKAKLWFATAFKDSRPIIETEDKSEGILFGNATAVVDHIHYSAKGKKVLPGERWTQKVEFVLKVFLKDNKAKIVISDIVMVNALVSSLRFDWTSAWISVAKGNLASEKADELAAGQTTSSIMAESDLFLRSLMLDVISALKRKAETDF